MVHTSFPAGFRNVHAAQLHSDEAGEGAAASAGAGASPVGSPAAVSGVGLGAGAGDVATPPVVVAAARGSDVLPALRPFTLKGSSAKATVGGCQPCRLEPNPGIMLTSSGVTWRGRIRRSGVRAAACSSRYLTVTVQVTSMSRASSRCGSAHTHTHTHTHTRREHPASWLTLRPHASP